MGAYYASLLRRRAGLPMEDSTKASHVDRLITEYVRNPDNARFPAQRLSEVASARGPNPLGAPKARVALQGELFGYLLDLLIRDQTNGTRTLDDWMRAVMTAHNGTTGYTPEDLQATAARVCTCDARPLFETIITGARTIEFNKYFNLAGLRVRPLYVSENGNNLPAARVEEVVNADGRERALRLLWKTP
jgi:predicted metalloprotease with PDZ domain